MYPSHPAVYADAGRCTHTRTHRPRAQRSPTDVTTDAKEARARETNRAGMRAACVCVCAFPGGDGVIRQVKLEA